MDRILVAGFGPFGGDPVNPSLEAVKLLEGRILAGHRVVAAQLPVVRGECVETLLRHIRKVDPVLVVAIGLAGGRVEITPERVAINVDDYRIPDNGGNQPTRDPVVAGGPVGYWRSRWPRRPAIRPRRRSAAPRCSAACPGA